MDMKRASVLLLHTREAKAERSQVLGHLSRRAKPCLRKTNSILSRRQSLADIEKRTLQGDGKQNLEEAEQVAGSSSPRGRGDLESSSPGTHPTLRAAARTSLLVNLSTELFSLVFFSISSSFLNCKYFLTCFSRLYSHRINSRVYLCALVSLNT